MAARSIQQLCRAAFSLGAAASTSAPLAAQLGSAGCGLRTAAAAATSGSSLQQAASAAAGLQQLARVCGAIFFRDGCHCTSSLALQTILPGCIQLHSRARSSFEPSLFPSFAHNSLLQHFHASAAPCWAAGDEGPAMNPLQQAPAPLAGSPLAGPGLPYGMAPLGALQACFHWC